MRIKLEIVKLEQNIYTLVMVLDNPCFNLRAILLATFRRVVQNHRTVIEQ